jgi:hypothetical protein
MMRASLLVLCISFPLTAVAGVYKWTDASGHVHYSDQAASEQAKIIKGAPPQSEDAKAAQQALSEKDLAFKTRQAETAKAKEKADKDAEAARAKQANCERARSTLATLGQNGRTYTTDSYGQRNYMTDQQRLDARADAQRFIAENCR